jgi:hypothetical protein
VQSRKQRVAAGRLEMVVAGTLLVLGADLT